MSITTATTSIDLAWQEIDVVSFTAGTLASITEMTTEIQAKLQRGTLSATTRPTSTQVQQWCTRGKEMLCERFGFTWARRYAYASLTASSYRFALPADYAGGPLRVRDITNENWMTKIGNLAFDSNYPSISDRGATLPSTGYFTIKDRELWLSNPASGTTTIELEYQRSGDDGTATDMDFLPEMARWKVVDYALSEAFEALHQWESAKYYRNKWEYEVGVTKKADARKKWTAMGFRAQNWL